VERSSGQGDSALCWLGWPAWMITASFAATPGRLEALALENNIGSVVDEIIRETLEAARSERA
jgi:hypothetical protein